MRYTDTTTTERTSPQVQTLTTHALARMRQRGLQDELIDLVLTWGDREVNAGQGCTALSFAPLGVAGLAGTGVAKAQKGRSQ